MGVRLHIAFLSLLCLAGCGEKLDFFVLGNRSDLFVQSRPITQIDILLVVDNSKSMNDERAVLRDLLPEIYDEMNSRKTMNSRIAVTNTDDFGNGGNLIADDSGNLFVSSSDPGATTRFAQMINKVVPTNTGNWEQQLKSAYHAVSKHGLRFMRDNVPLAIILLSDEPEGSQLDIGNGWAPYDEANPNPDWVPVPVSTYADYFRQLTGINGNGALFFSVVGGSSACSARASDAKYGDRYEEVLTLLPTGFRGSICFEHVKDFLLAIADYFSRLSTRWELSEKASPSTLQVYFDGIRVPRSRENGWDYDPLTNSISFSGNYIPANGTHIQVYYAKERE